MKEELEHYKVEPDAFWQAAWVYGDGYGVMEQAERKVHGWCVISGWGRDGYDLGSWPLVMVFFRQRHGFEVAYYVEGDVVCYAAPTEAIRNAIVDEIAFFHWKHQGEQWVEGYDSVEQLPDELRGPYRARVR